MAAAFGKTLILDLNRLRTRLFQQPHRALDIERIAVTGIRIDDEISIHAIADQRYGLDHFRDADQPDVRPPQPRIGDRRAGNIERAETGLRGDQRGERIVNARRDHNWLLRQLRAQRVLLGHGYSPRKARLRPAYERISAALPDMTKLPCSRM